MSIEPPLLELKGIDTCYGPVQVHFGLDLTVDRSEIVCLLGGNASGKSTVMKVILGLLEPRAGSVLWEGRPWTEVDTPGRIRAGVASVPEARRLFGEMSVGENLLMGAYVRRDRAQVLRDREEILDLFPDLRHRFHQAAGTLSGGEQQMTALGRALMGRPRLICMDEPTMGLSPLWVGKIWDLVGILNRRGTAFLLIEQNAHLALELAHRGYVLQNGRLVLEGPASQLKDDPRIREAYLGTDQMDGI